jgi:hypothetical protein
MISTPIRRTSESLSDALFESIAELRYSLDSSPDGELSAETRHLLGELIAQVSNALIALNVPESRGLLELCQQQGF